MPVCVVEVTDCSSLIVAHQAILVEETDHEREKYDAFTLHFTIYLLDHHKTVSHINLSWFQRGFSILVVMEFGNVHGGFFVKGEEDPRKHLTARLAGTSLLRSRCLGSANWRPGEN